jgi:dTDP-4-dehydrorhamnose reductase
MKIAIFGSTGLVGMELSRQMLRKGYELILPTRELAQKHLFPVSEEDEYDAYTYYSGADFFINCIGYTNVDGAEQHKEECHKINVTMAGQIAVLARKFHKPVIYLSSDYVYKGDRKIWGGMGWVPTNLNSERHEFLLIPYDKPERYGKYAQSKLLGELLTQDNGRHYIIRTSWLFGGHRRTWMDIVKDNPPKLPHIYALNYGTPTYVPHLCQAIIKIVEKEPEYGIYNFANTVKKPVTKEYALQEAGRLLKLNGRQVTPFEYFECPPGAPRPFNSALDTTKFRHNIWSDIPTLEEAIQEWVNSGK